MIIVFWDKGKNSEHAIVKKRIVSFYRADNRDGTMIVIDGTVQWGNPRFGTVWVKESFEEVLKKWTSAGACRMSHLAILITGNLVAAYLAYGWTEIALIMALIGFCIGTTVLAAVFYLIDRERKLS